MAFLVVISARILLCSGVQQQPASTAVPWWCGWRFWGDFRLYSAPFRRATPASIDSSALVALLAFLGLPCSTTPAQPPTLLHLYKCPCPDSAFSTRPRTSSPLAPQLLGWPTNQSSSPEIRDDSTARYDPTARPDRPTPATTRPPDVRQTPAVGTTPHPTLSKPSTHPRTWDEARLPDTSVSSTNFVTECPAARPPDLGKIWTLPDARHTPAPRPSDLVNH